VKKRVYYSIAGLLILISINIACNKEERIELPVVSTAPVSNIGSTTAVSGGNIALESGGTITARGIVWGTINNPNLMYNKGFTNDGTGTGIYTSYLTGLLKNTTYYIRAYATNGAGTNFGIEVIFTTLAEQATITTANPGNVTSVSASCGGNVTDNGGASVFERGVCWGIAELPTIYNSHTDDGTGAGEFVSLITRLTPGITYFVRAYARNYLGTSYGNQVSFMTPSGSGTGEIAFNPSLTYGSATDADGNIYKTIQIGTQTWMAENLKTTKFRNGDLIPEITDRIQWKNLISGAYSNYNNEAGLSAVYGCLYNWYATNDNRNLAPDGWHVATDNDWTKLVDYLGGKGLAAYKLIETGTSHWAVPNSGATNESGFSALPGGFLLTGEGYFGVGSISIWWSATEVDITYGSYWEIVNIYNRIDKYGYNKTDGHSVRCVKD
jgi:uncharacterized protein (TIGR02145 family)